MNNQKMDIKMTVGMCRLCASLLKTDILTTITDEICTKLRSCCQVEIRANDPLPKSVCKDCVQTLYLAFAFYTKVHESQESLYTLFELNQQPIETAEKSNTVKEKKQSTLAESLALALQQPEQLRPATDKNSQTNKTEKQMMRTEMLESFTEETDADLKEVVEIKEDYVQLVEVYEILDKENVNELQEKENINEYKVKLKPKQMQITQAAAYDTNDEVQLIEEYMESLDENTELQQQNAQIDAVDAAEILEKELDEEIFEELEALEVSILPEDSIPEKDDEEQHFVEEHLDVSENESLCSPKMPATSWKDYAWRCYLCSETMTNFPDLFKHAEIEHGIQDENDMQFICADCQKTCSNYYSFINHVRQRHQPSLALCCDICDEHCESFEKLDLHRQTACLGRDKTYSFFKLCNECGKAFLHQNSLQSHMRNQHAKQDKVFSCSHCEKKFKRIGQLRGHQRVHSDNKDFTCELCGRAFRQKINLEMHLYSHVTEKPYECVLCKKRFKNSIILEKHTLVHTDIKNFSCEYCKKPFRTKDAKISHERIHTGELPYKCEHCDRRFRFRSTFTSHVNTHTGVRPYSCLECDHHFTNWSNYNKHMKRRHYEGAVAKAKTKNETVTKKSTTTTSQPLKSRKPVKSKSKVMRYIYNENMEMVEAVNSTDETESINVRQQI